MLTILGVSLRGGERLYGRALHHFRLGDSPRPQGAQCGDDERHHVAIVAGRGIGADVWPLGIRGSGSPAAATRPPPVSEPCLSRLGNDSDVRLRRLPAARVREA